MNKKNQLYFGNFRNSGNLEFIDYFPSKIRNSHNLEKPETLIVNYANTLISSYLVKVCQTYLRIIKTK